MLIAWINDNKQLNFTDSLDRLPIEYRSRCKIFENLTLEDAEFLYIDKGDIKFAETEEEKVKILKQRKLEELKFHLSNALKKTDWIIIKCIDLGLDIKETYPEIKKQRDQIRELGNILEELINKATTLDELNKISFDELKIETKCYE